MDKSTDSEFVGNLNHVTYNSYYYDQETGWYYCGRYYDAVGERFVDGNTLTLEGVMAKAKAKRSVYLENYAYELYEWAIMNAEFGASVSGDWYSSVSVMSLVARVIYAENPYNGTPYTEQLGVGWVIWNRKQKNQSYLGGNTLYSVVTYDGAFAGILNKNAREPITTSKQWDSAVNVASYLFAAEDLGCSTAELEKCCPRPIGFGNDYVYFVIYSSMHDRQSYITFYSAVIAGYGSVGSTVESLEAALSAYQSRIEYSGTYINVFYTGRSV